MLVSVPLPELKRVEDFRESAGDEAVDRLLETAQPFKGARMVHLSSTAFGGGVAELLASQIAILQDLGIEADWQLIDGSEEFFSVTKLVHNALQGAGVPWTEAMESTYLERLRTNAARFTESADFVFVHDPQPAALLTILEEEGRRDGKWVWRCHIDLSHPMEAVWGFFALHVNRYDAAVFTMDDFVRPGLQARVAVIPPSIDPLSPKNAWLEPEAVREILVSYGIDPDRPVVTQVSRFDPWKDPLGVIDAYRLAKEEVRDLQLVLVGSMAHDDPEGWHYLEQTEERRASDPDVHVLTNLQGVGDTAVNAFQRDSDVVIQKSIREGFGLTVSEAMWKEKPVIAGNAGGLRLQVEEGKTGYLVDSVEQCAERLLELLQNPGLRDKMGAAGKARVRDRFFTVREVTEYLELLSQL
ncbi:MAG TPA: glycosyltransferase [Actinomycetota bacterium]|nr:glycosyltransferase [Actinomycetota bacterium]